MKQDTDKFTLGEIFRISIMQLTGIHKNAAALLQSYYISIYIIIHMPGQYCNKFHIIMPMASCGIIGIVGEVPFTGIHRKVRSIIMYSERSSFKSIVIFIFCYVITFLPKDVRLTMELL